MVKPVNLIDRRLDKTVSRAAFSALEAALAAEGCAVRITGFWENRTDALQLVVGEADSLLVEELHRVNGLSLPARKEGVYIHACAAGEVKLCVISGGDAAGLAYSLYECAARVCVDGIKALETPASCEEYPQTRQRGVDRYIMSHLDEEWWLDEAFWEKYLERLQACRFNKFTLITGFDTSYLTPPYPYFVQVGGFEAVGVQGFDEARREKNLHMLQKISKLCELHGIEFCFASWQQAPWTESQQSRIGGLPTEPEMFARYCAEGMRRLLQECPSIRIVQLRVNMESGMSTGEETGKTNTDTLFWRGMMDAIAGAGHPVQVEIRAKGATDQLLQYAESIGLDVCVATKYWCEHMPLPYHIPMLRGEEREQPENMNCGRRYSYGDLLRKPHWYRMLYRLWNYGSANLFLWGGADYARRFMESLTPFGGDGFTINAPLSLKGGMEDVASEKTWRARLEYGTVSEEDERYWALYSAFGLIGYNTQSGTKAFKRLFTLHFGTNAETFYQLYETSSLVLPLITTVHFPVHPSLHYWPELYPGAALFGKNNAEPLFGELDYAHTLPSDEALFYSISEFAQDVVAHTEKPKYTPYHTQAWLHCLSEKIRSLLKTVPERRSAEMECSLVDFTMLACLAEFHARKIGAALHLSFFKLEHRPEELKTAYADMQLALKEWEQIAEIGMQHYHLLQFNAGTGTQRCGSWAERLKKEVGPDTRMLLELLHKSGVSADGAPSVIEAPAEAEIIDRTPAVWPAGRELPLLLEMPGVEAAEVKAHYRHMNHMEGIYRACRMQHKDGRYCAVVPADYLDGNFDLIVYYTVRDKKGNIWIHPGVKNQTAPMPYRVVEIRCGQ